jgi:hypothetical protein
MKSDVITISTQRLKPLFALRPSLQFIYINLLQQLHLLCLISGSRRDVGKICVLPRYYGALSGSYLPTFRDNLSVPSSRVKRFIDP